MTRKTDSGTNNTAAANRAAASLRHLRSSIDKLDLQILKLVNERAGLAAEIGQLKNDHGNEVFSPAREEEVLHHSLPATLLRDFSRGHDCTLQPTQRSSWRVALAISPVCWHTPERLFELDTCS